MINTTEKKLPRWSALFKEEILKIQDQCDISHRIDHFERITNMAYKLSILEAANINVTIPAAWLHDCVPISKKDPRNKMSSTIAAAKAKEILIKMDYPQQYIEEIGHAITAHSFSGSTTPETIEAKVVQDADRLDALGSIGIARCLMLGATFDNQLYHPQEPFPIHREINDREFIIDHFYKKLFPIAKTFNTKSGQAEAAKRIQIMQQFIEQLKDEIILDHNDQTSNNNHL